MLGNDLLEKRLCVPKLRLWLDEWTMHRESSLQSCCNTRLTKTFNLRQNSILLKEPSHLFLSPFLLPFFLYYRIRSSWERTTENQTQRPSLTRATKKGSEFAERLQKRLPIRKKKEGGGGEEKKRMLNSK